MRLDRKGKKNATLRQRNRLERRRKVSGSTCNFTSFFLANPSQPTTVRPHEHTAATCNTKREVAEAEGERARRIETNTASDFGGMADLTAAAGAGGTLAGVSGSGYFPMSEEVFVQLPSRSLAVQRYGDLIGRCHSEHLATGRVLVKILGHPDGGSDMVEIEKTELQVRSHMGHNSRCR